MYPSEVYGRFPDGYFPGWFFSRQDVSRVVIFPDETFPGKTSWTVGLMFNCSYLQLLLIALPIRPINQLVSGKNGASWYPVLPGSSSF